jgi:predicted nucleic acid-binding Zn ribbon protein
MHPVREAVPPALASVLRRQPLSPGKVAFAWRVAVGVQMARATHPRLTETGALVVDASGEHWARETIRSMPQILARLETLLGPDVVRRVEVRAAQALDRQPPP